MAVARAVGARAAAAVEKMARAALMVVAVLALAATCVVSPLATSLVPPAMAEWEPEDEFWADVVGSTAKVSHRFALYNCGIAGVEYVVASDEPGLIAVTEHDIEGEQLDCMCYFVASFYMWEVPAGDWIVALNYFDYESDGWLITEIPFTIEVDDGGEIAMGDFEKSDCLSAPTAVPEIEWPITATWSVLKAIYR